MVPDGKPFYKRRKTAVRRGEYSGVKKRCIAERVADCRSDVPLDKAGPEAEIKMCGAEQNQHRAAPKEKIQFINASDNNIHRFHRMGCRLQ